MNDSILCVGELLWDALPDGLFLGGAPYNVAYHLRQHGLPAALATRVGADRLGSEALRRVAQGGVDTRFVQTDPALATGFVEVEVDADGIPQYDIVAPVAWDALALVPDLCEAAASARAVVFGTLAQRKERSRATVQALVAEARLAVFDVNLRPPFLVPDTVQASLEAADIVKLNEEELGVLADWFGFPDGERTALEALAARFDCQTVCVTHGADGAALWHAEAWRDHPGYRVTVRDTVGAGDAFLAGLLGALLNGRDAAEVLDAACRSGAYIATRAGATPAYDADAPTLGEL